MIIIFFKLARNKWLKILPWKSGIGYFLFHWWKIRSILDNSTLIQCMIWSFDSGESNNSQFRLRKSFTTRKKLLYITQYQNLPVYFWNALFFMMVLSNSVKHIGQSIVCTVVQLLFFLAANDVFFIIYIKIYEFHKWIEKD